MVPARPLLTRRLVSESVEMDIGVPVVSDFPAHLLDGLDLAEFDRICHSVKSSRHKLKYADLNAHMKRAWKEAERLSLHKSPPLDVLDIGLGTGYFLHVCQRLGHCAVGLDRPGFEFWQRIRKWLGVHNVVEHTVRPNTPLPDLGRFDIATAYACPFNFVQSERRLWSVSEWSFFFDQLRDDVLKPNGRLALKLRKRYAAGFEPDPRETELWAQLFRQRGATGLGSVLLFDPLR
jgi:SAM-dependent methyltransferase